MSTEDSGFTGARFSRGVPLCSLEDIPESFGVRVALGQLSPSMCRVLHLEDNTTFSFWILPWKEIFLGNIIGSPPTGKILPCFLPCLIFLLNLCLTLNTDTTTKQVSLFLKVPTSFQKFWTYFRVAKTALDLCTSKFLPRHFCTKDQNKF